MQIPAGIFVTLEGIDGSGKSTQIVRLAETLRARDRDVVVTREPGGAPGAEEIRRLLLEGPPDRWSPETEILLFTAARRDHVERTIRPALARGAVVLCDRFVDSTRAYQGSGPRRAAVDLLHERMIGLDPDLTLILDIDPEAALRRALSRAGSETLFAERGLDFQKTLRDAFHRIADAEPGRCLMIDADRSEDAIAADLAAALDARIKAR